MLLSLLCLNIWKSSKNTNVPPEPLHTQVVMAVVMSLLAFMWIIVIVILWTRKSAFFVSRGVLDSVKNINTLEGAALICEIWSYAGEKMSYMVVCLCLSYAGEMYIAISFPISSVYTRKASHLADMPFPSALSFSSHLTKWSYLVSLSLSLLLPLWELCLLITFLLEDSRSLSKQWGRRERNVVFGPSFSLFPLRLFVSKTNVPTLSTSSLCTNSYQLSSPLYP